MRVVFMGTPAFAVPTLEVIAGAGHQVVAVVTQPDRPVGRKRVPTPPPVKVAAEALGIQVLQPRSVNLAGVQDDLGALKADVAVVLAFGQILRPRTLELFPLGCINVHGSLLPQYRGAAPVQRAIMAGERHTGVTVMRMDEGLDTGPVLLTHQIPIGPDDTSADLLASLANEGAHLMVETLERMAKGQAVFTPQPAEGASYAAKLTEADSPIDWSCTSLAIHNQVRGLNPAPGASTCLDGLRVRVWRTVVPTGDVCAIGEGEYPPGTVVAVGQHTVVVQTGEGYIELVDVQAAGSRRMGAAEFARGKRLDACECILAEPEREANKDDEDKDDEG